MSSPVSLLLYSLQKKPGVPGTATFLKHREESLKSLKLFVFGRLLKIFMNSGEPSDYLWNREIFVLQDCNTYLAIVVVPYYCDPGRYLGNNLQLGRENYINFQKNLFFFFHLSQLELIPEKASQCKLFVFVTSVLKILFPESNYSESLLSSPFS